VFDRNLRKENENVQETDDDVRRNNGGDWRVGGNIFWRYI
jgi:hypothetical protein